MINPIASNLSPTQSATLPWPQRFTTGVKTLWGAAQPAATTTTETTTDEKPVLLALRASPPPDRPDVLYLTVAGALGRATYAILVETAALHYQQGCRYLLLDLGQTTQIHLSGLFALCNIARLYSGLPLLDPDLGWAALHAAAESLTPTLGECIKVVAPSPVAKAALAQASFCRFFTCYPDMATALATLDSALPPQG